MATLKPNKKIKEMLNLSESILSSLEDGKSLEEVISKCKKLARLRSDDAAIKWFMLELNGYDYNTLPPGIQSSDVYIIALAAGRGFQYYDVNTQKNEPRFWPESVSSIESLITNNQVSLENLKPPTNYTPAITKVADGGFMGGATFLQESFRDVLNAIRVHQENLSTTINSKKTLLSKIRSYVYDYVLSINLQLKFENLLSSTHFLRQVSMTIV